VSETSRFTQDILSAAKEKALQIVTQAETETQRALDGAKVHISREAEDIVRIGRTEAEGIKLRRVSEVRHRLKLHEQQEKSRIMSEVLEGTRKRVVEITDIEAKYLPYLASFIESGIRELGSENVLVHLNANDLKRFDKGALEREIVKTLEKRPRIDWSKEPIVALGGAVVSTSDNKARIVNTLDERFEALEPKLLIEAGKLLFGE
jgi:vacuolar-type H+-ATPase subunit E/Vma4